MKWVTDFIGDGTNPTCSPCQVCNTRTAFSSAFTLFRKFIVWDLTYMPKPICHAWTLSSIQKQDISCTYTDSKKRRSLAQKRENFVFFLTDLGPMIRTDLFQGSSVSQVVASRSPVSEASTLMSTDHQFLDTYDARASVDLFSFPVSAFENDGFSIMSPLDLSPFDQDVEVLEEDEDTQDKSCLPQAGPSSSPI